MADINNLCMGCMNDNGGEDICPLCGFDKNSPLAFGAMELKSVIGNRYIVGKALLGGGDGITYIGFDTVTQKPVRIREYFPEGICARGENMAVRVKKEASYVYNSGIMDFLDLSKKLLSLENLNGICPVLDVFEQNGTAYRISEYIAGITLNEFLLRNGGNLSWEQARPLFLPVFSTLSQLHTAGIIHRGISPDTLLVGRDGKLRLCEFSIAKARNTSSDMTARLYAGYAAVEQYGYQNLSDGTFTDVYGLSACIFRTLIGNPPPAANNRITDDNMSFPRRLAEVIPQNVLVALANGLQILPEDRTASIEELRKDLQAEMADNINDEPLKNPEKVKAEKKNNKNYTVKAAIITAVAILLIVLILIFTVFRETLFGKPNDTSSTIDISSITSVANTQSQGDGIMDRTKDVPDFSGKTYAEVLKVENNANWFKFTIAKKEYSSVVEKGKIMGQSIAKGQAAKRDTEIALTISLGPSSFKLPSSLKGMKKDQAHIKLLEMGIEPSCIDFVGKYSDTPQKEQVVMETSPALGSEINTDTPITVFYNMNVVVESSNTSSLSDTVTP
ncbi:MAG: PASTA domain-containing protein [Oscillospiraceae bacterium]|nr:PASTA domain-containing protein [Candidatus Equicaccousia limihippi]